MKAHDIKLDDILPVLRKPLAHDVTPEAFRQHQLLLVCTALFCEEGDTIDKKKLLAELGNVTREDDPESGLEFYVAENLPLWFSRRATEMLMSERQHLEAKISAHFERLSTQELQAVLHDLEQAE